MKLQNPNILDLSSLYNVAEEIINNYKEQLELDNTVASGDLLNSIEWNIVQKDENTLTLEMSLFNYWYWVEYGREKTKKLEDKWENPVEDISRWIINKISRGKFLPKPDKKIPTTQKEIRQVSYAIVNKIHEVGYYGDGDTHYGKHSLEKSLQKSENEQLFERFVNALVQPLCGEIVAELNTLSKRQQPKQRRVKPF